MFLDGVNMTVILSYLELTAFLFFLQHRVAFYGISLICTYHFVMF